ncbi:MAG: hypothetical protein JWM27_529 [Gemmatimonadetes bacterium]|nr:hypothetical protein [Gemmatimonadota bacterium]
MEASKIGLDDVIVATADQVAAEVGDEVVILNLRDEVYYGLGAVGARIWELIQQPTPVRRIRDTVVAEYDVAEADAERDLLELLAELAARGLVDVRGDAG